MQVEIHSSQKGNCSLPHQMSSAVGWIVQVELHWKCCGLLKVDGAGAQYHQELEQQVVVEWQDLIISLASLTCQHWGLWCFFHWSWIPVGLAYFEDPESLPGCLKFWVKENIRPQCHLSRNITCKPKVLWGRSKQYPRPLLNIMHDSNTRLL